MNDKRGFWLAVGGALAASSVLLTMQFVRSSQTGGGEPWLLPAAMVVSFLPIVLAIAFLSAVAAGWNQRASRLKAQGVYDVIAPIMKSERMETELWRVNPLGRRRRLPRALTLTANSDGIGIWSGRKTVELEIWLPWSTIEAIEATLTRDPLESFRGLIIHAQWGDERVGLPMPVTGSSPFGTRIAGTDALSELIADLNRVRRPG